MTHRGYSDADLAAAIAGARSWRGVLRTLGLNPSAAGSMHSARRHADRLGISYDHFTGQRRWSDAQLVAAVAAAASWSEVARTLGLLPVGGTLAALKAHAHRLGVEVQRIDQGPQLVSDGLRDGAYDPTHLRTAGSLFAATWFTLRGWHVAWPLEPCRYDLVVDAANNVHRIQVKTTIGIGPAAVVQLSNARRSGRAVYTPGEIDSFFILDAALTAYLIPYVQVAGYKEIRLGRYDQFAVVRRGDLVGATASVCASRGP